MRRHRVLEITSPQSLCVSCACRYLGDASAASQTRAISRRRWLNTSQRPQQVAQAAQSDTSNQNEQRQGLEVVWHAGGYSTLTAAEQLERAQRQQVRLQQETLQQRRLIEDLNQKENADRDGSLVGGSQRRTGGLSPSEQLRSGENEIQARNGPVGQRRTRNRSGVPLITYGIGNSGPTSPKSQGEPNSKAVVNRSSGQHAKEQQKFAPKRVAMPSFGSGGLNNTEAGDKSRWGGSVSERQPLVYSDKTSDGNSWAQRASASLGAAHSLEPTSAPIHKFVTPSSDNQHVAEQFGSSTPESGNGNLRADQTVNHSNARDSFRSSEMDNEYRRRPLKQSGTTAESSAHNEDEPTSWRHLNAAARNYVHSQPQAQVPIQFIGEQSQGIRPIPLADQEIESSFEAHRTSRYANLALDPSASYTPNPNIQTFSSAREARRSVETRCARCLEFGHRANECTGPQRSTCHRCGQVGHFANDCPTKIQQSGTRNTTRFTKNDGDASVAPSKTTPFFDRRVVTVQNGDGHSAQSLDKSGLGLQWPSKRSSQKYVTEDESDGAVFARRSRTTRWSDEDDTNEVLTSENPRWSKKSGRQVSRQGLNTEAEDEGEAIREMKAARKAARKAEKDKKAMAAMYGQLDAEGTQIRLPRFISVSNLAQALGVRYEAFVSRLQQFGYDDIFPGKILNMETSGMIAMEYNFEPIFEDTSDDSLQDEQRNLKAQPEVKDKMMLTSRPPVVTIMGHVDHGKTTILDYLRKSSVALGEAGGITQHIGAFSVPLAASGKTITFLDTPGHAAFLAMRQRGANVTDIVILVVAADDSVKPQTLEALRHARSANVPIIVAVNKVDKEEADVQRVKQDLARHGIEIEDFGGDTQVIPVSGKTGLGIDKLEEAIVTLSEILDHRADADGMVEGWVLEATTKRSGRTATVLVRRGTLKAGAVIVAGKTWARVRTLRNEGGLIIDEIGPGMPVEVDGWRDQPTAGDEVLEAPTEQKATSVVDYRLELAEREKMSEDMEAINEARRLEQERKANERIISNDDTKSASKSSQPEGDENTADSTGQIVVPFIVKADVSGSAEAVAAYVLSVSSPLICPRILTSQVGNINESDIELAAAANGHIIAFNITPDESMKGQAAANGVQVLENNIIYRVVEDVKTVLEERLPPLVTQRVLGEAEIGASFDIGIGGRKKMMIAGCKIRNGAVRKGSRVRVLRKGDKIYDGSINSLKNVKKDVQEMRKGTECGMAFEEWEGFEVGDQVQTYEVINEKRKLNL